MSKNGHYKGYRFAVQWIACNDSDETFILDHQTVQLVAAIYDKDPQTVVNDVNKLLRKM